LFADFASAIINMEQKDVYILNRALTLTTVGIMTKKLVGGGEAFQ
jgi:hypothetical protein